MSASHLDAVLKGLTPEEMAEMLALMEELDQRKRVATAQTDFLAFIAMVDRTYKFGAHLKRLGNLLMDTEAGTKDRVAVSMAPRFGKSQMISIYFPAWYLGRNPDHKIIVASHTADLAVDMARKVRNLMQTAEYKAIFPNVSIAADAKAAGKWNTNKGGEYYACLRRYALVHTDRGPVPAGQIQVGDRLANASGYVTVQQVYLSRHEATYSVAGLPCSAEHPVWTMNRGWVYARDIAQNDLLCVESISDRMKALFRRIHGYLEHPNVPTLVQHQEPVRKPEEREVGGVRGAGGFTVRTLAGLRKLCARHGGAAEPAAYRGSDRRKRPLQPGELPLGNAGGAGEQQAQQRTAGRQDVSGTCQRAWSDAGDNSVPHSDGCRAAGAHEAAQEELRAYGAPEDLGWLRSAVAQVLTRCGAGRAPGQPRCSPEGYMARAGEAAQKLLGLCVGVRRAGVVRTAEHAPAPFVNFRTDGDHTFYADGVLTHNCGVGGALAGRGGDLIIVDDPLSEQDIKNGNFDSLDVVYEWFRAGLRTRLMPGGRLAILHTRWHSRDLIGRLLKDSAMNEEADQYEMFEFPAILNDGNPEDHPTDPPKSLWPQQWSLESLLRTKASMPLWQWNAQYMQNPTAQDSALIKREWIQWWDKPEPPAVDFIVQAWDTALTTKERSDWSVCQTWGVWFNESTNLQCAILLNNAKFKLEFPDLKEEARRQFANWQPDSVIIEAKASGQPLIDEMRRSGIFVQDFSPGKGQDKIARVNSVADMFASGQVWVPETSWAEDAVEEWTSFPSADHDDQTDTMTLALRRIRQGGLLRLASDPVDNWEPTYHRRKGAYTV